MGDSLVSINTREALWIEAFDKSAANAPYMLEERASWCEHLIGFIVRIELGPCNGFMHDGVRG